MRKFWNYVNDWLKKVEKRRKVVLMGGMKGSVGSIELAGVVGKSGIDGVSKNGEHLIDICVEREIVFTKHFQHRMTPRYMWKRDERSE